MQRPPAFRLIVGMFGALSAAAAGTAGFDELSLTGRIFLLMFGTVLTGVCTFLATDAPAAIRSTSLIAELQHLLPSKKILSTHVVMWLCTHVVTSLRERLTPPFLAHRAGSRQDDAVRRQHLASAQIDGYRLFSQMARQLRGTSM